MPNVYLEVLGRQSKIRRIALKSSITIGRQKGCKLRIPSRAISREHCRIELTNGHVSVTDLGSSNGTWVNGKRLDAHTTTVVEDASKLAVGNEKFRIVVQATDNMEATVVDQNLFAAAASASADLGATVIEPPTEANLATEADIDVPEVTQEVASDVVPIPEATTETITDEAKSEFDMADLEEFDLLADEEELVAEAAPELVQDNEPIVTDEQTAEPDPDSIAEVAPADVLDEEEAFSEPDEEALVVAEVEELAAEPTPAEEVAAIEPDSVVDEPAAELEEQPVPQEIEAAPEAVQGNLFDFADEEVEDEIEPPLTETADDVAEASDTIAVDESAEPVAIESDLADDDFGFGVGVEATIDEEVVAEIEEQVEASEDDDEAPVAEVTEVIDDEFVAVVEEETETEALPFLTEDIEVAETDDPVVVEDTFEPEATSDAVVAEAEDEVVVAADAEQGEFAFLADEDDQIDPDLMAEAVAETIEHDDSSSVLNEATQGDSVLDLADEELPVAEYVGDDEEIPVAVTIEDDDENIPEAVAVEEADEVAVAIIEDDEAEEQEILVAEQADSADDDSEFELVAEEDDDDDFGEESAGPDADPLASTMMMTHEVQAFDPQAADTGFSLGGPIEVPEEELAVADETIVMDDVLAEDDVTAIVEPETAEIDDESDVVPAPPEAPQKKGGLFGWLNIFKRKKTEEPAQVIDDLEDDEITVEETAVSAAEVDESDETIVESEDDVETLVVDDFEGEDEAAIVEDVAAFGAVEPTIDIDTEDEELTAVDRSQFVDDDETAAAISAEDDAMDFLTDIGDGEDMAASFLGDGDAPAPAKTDDSDFEDFFADVKE